MYPPALGWPPFALRRITLVRWRHCLSRLEFQEFSREIPQWSDRGMTWEQSLYTKRPRARPVDRCVVSLHGPPRGCDRGSEAQLDRDDRRCALRLCFDAVFDSGYVRSGD